MSENGYTTTQEIILWSDVLKLKPKVVIHLNGYNDLYTGHSGKPAGWNHDFIYENFRLYKWIKYKINKIYPPINKEVHRTDLGEVVDTYKNMYVISYSACKGKQN